MGLGISCTSINAKSYEVQPPKKELISTDDPYPDTKVKEVQAARAETFSLAKSYSACAIHPVSLEYP